MSPLAELDAPECKFEKHEDGVRTARCTEVDAVSDFVCDAATNFVHVEWKPADDEDDSHFIPCDFQTYE